MIDVAYVQLRNNRLEKEESFIVKELEKLNIPYKTYTTKNILRRELPLNGNSLVVGDVDCTHGALKQLGIDLPPAMDYPESLEHLLHRRVWSSELAAVLKRFDDHFWATSNFIKPKGRTKCFTGKIVDSLESVQSIRVSKRQAIYCSDIVEFLVEYRAYIVNSRMVHLSFYRGDQNVGLDLNIVQEAISILDANQQSHSGYSLDFGVLSTGETALIEMNDGISLGAYDIASHDYFNVIFSRWNEILEAHCKPCRNTIS